MKHGHKTDSLTEMIMAKGIAAHYPADVLTDAEKLHGVWAARFHSTRPWAVLPSSVRVAWCEVVLAARKLGARS
jgi:hypothetical protein